MLVKKMYKLSSNLLHVNKKHISSIIVKISLISCNSDFDVVSMFYLTLTKLYNILLQH